MLNFETLNIIMFKAGGVFIDESCELGWIDRTDLRAAGDFLEAVGQLVSSIGGVFTVGGFAQRISAERRQHFLEVYFHDRAGLV